MSATPPRIGVEHEFQVFDRRRSVDARALLPTLVLDGGRWDPGDRHAVRGAWGGVITADGRELEIATPAVRMAAGAIGRVEDLTIAGRATALRALPPDHSLRGYSTHLNVELPDAHVVAAARIIAQRMAPALMLLLDRQDSPGLIVRPRHGRLEIGGEYACGARLRRSLTLASGIARLAHRAVRDRTVRARLPPPLRLRLRPSPQRYGLYVDRRAGGGDLYTAGRGTRFARARGGTITAHQVLVETWRLARAELVGSVDDVSLMEVDHVVEADDVLPVFGDAEVYGPSDRTEDVVPWPTPLVPKWSRGRFDVVTEAATWHKVVLRVDTGAQSRWLTVPGEEIDAVIERLEAGQLDRWLGSLFAT